MASTKCPACGRQNFTTAIVCRHCNYALFGEEARTAALSPASARKGSFRWLRRATLFSILLGVLLFPAVFLFLVVLSAKHGAETGFDFTSEQMTTMVKWYVTLLGISVVIIFTLFYLRRNKHDL